MAGNNDAQYGVIRQTLGRLADAADLSNDRYRPVAVPLMVSLTTTTTTGKDTYVIPGKNKFVITRVRGHISLTSILTETLSIMSGTTGVGNVGFLDRLAMKAVNAKLKLQDVDATKKIFDGTNDLILASILELVGGSPLDFSETPFIAGQGDVIQLDVSLQQTDSAVVGGATEYGVVLEGFLYRVEE